MCLKKKKKGSDALRRVWGWRWEKGAESPEGLCCVLLKDKLGHSKPFQSLFEQKQIPVGQRQVGNG